MGKDNDWIKDEKTLHFSEDVAKNFQNLHKEDTDFLSSCHVMDYSMLVGIAKKQKWADECPAAAWKSKNGDEVYCVGIIDYLVAYGARKRAEHALHELRGRGETASVTDPPAYAIRQRAFVAEHMLKIPALPEDEVTRTSASTKSLGGIS